MSSPTCTKIPESLGRPLLLVGNPYVQTKKLYVNAVRPAALYVNAVAPWVFVGLSRVAFAVGPVVSPLALPLLRTVGIDEFKGVSRDAKDNVRIVVGPEGNEEVVIIGGDLMGCQPGEEFDYFAARVVETARALHLPGRANKQ